MTTALPLSAQTEWPGYIDPTFLATCLTNTAYNNTVKGLLVQPDGKIIAVGGFGDNFVTPGRACANAIFRCTSNGVPDGTFNSPFAALSFTDLNAISPAPGDKLLVAGKVGVNNASFAIARLNANGSLDATFVLNQTNPPGSFSLVGNAVDVDSNNRIIFGGTLDVTRAYIKRLNSNGAEDGTFGGGAISTPYVGGIRALAIQPDNKIIIGGQFTNVGPMVRLGLARLNENGSADETFQPAVRGQFTGIKLLNNGRMYVTGQFSTNTPQTYILARLNVDGSLDPTFPLTPAPAINATALALQPDGRIIVTHNLGASRFASQGAVDANYFHGAGEIATGGFVCAAVDGSSRAMVGGETATLSGTSRRGLMRLYGGDAPVPTPPSIDVQPSDLTVYSGNTATFSVTASGSSPLIYTWFFGGFNVGGSATVTFQNVLVAYENTSIYCVVTNLYGRATTDVVRLHVLPAPVAPSITMNPTSVTVSLDGSPSGATAVFSVAATGTVPLSYRWMKNGQPLNDGFVAASVPLLTGVNTSTLTISNVAAHNAGAYSCLVSNAAGKVTSALATLTVNGPPVTDHTPPTLTIVTPAASLTRVTSNSVNFAGTASDAGGIASVSIQRGTDAALPATGTTSWSASVQLQPGTNVLRFWARDLAGNDSATNTRTIFYAMTSPLNLVVTGSGTVKGAANGQVLEVGKSYTLTATPAVGFLFSNWSVGLTSSVAVLNFTMSVGLTLQAIFVPVPFTSWAGSYNGLFYETNGAVRHEASGLINLLLRADGSFSAKIQQGTKKYPFTGRFDLDGHFATNAVKRAGANSLSVAMTLDLHGGEQIVGSVGDGTWQAGLNADRATFNRVSKPATNYSGAYTILIPGGGPPDNTPEGDGAGGLSVDAGGIVKLTGSLADGSVITQKVPLGRQGGWPLYVPLYGGRGSLLGWIAISNSVLPDLGGRVCWSRPPGPVPKVHTNGFVVSPLLVGSVFQPFATNVIFDSTSAKISFHDGNLAADFTNHATLAGGKFVYTGTNKLTVVVVPTTGQFTGSVIPPGATKPITFKGAILLRQGWGGGYFLGTNKSGKVLIVP